MAFISRCSSLLTPQSTTSVSFTHTFIRWGQRLLLIASSNQSHVHSHRWLCLQEGTSTGCRGRGSNPAVLQSEDVPLETHKKVILKLRSFTSKPTVAHSFTIFARTFQGLVEPFHGEITSLKLSQLLRRLDTKTPSTRVQFSAPNFPNKLVTMASVRWVQEQ